MTVIAVIPRIERLLREPAGLEIDKSDLRRHEEFVNRKITTCCSAVELLGDAKPCIEPAVAAVEKLP